MILLILDRQKKNPMIIPLPCALISFSSTWSSCLSFYVHSFMILLIISCTKTCGLVAISSCHLHLHHMLLMPSLITLDHITLATLVSLNFQNQTWAFTNKHDKILKKTCSKYQTNKKDTLSPHTKREKHTRRERQTHTQKKKEKQTQGETERSQLN
jgi:hypothetical protein